MNQAGLSMERKTALTVSCPLELVDWLKRTQQNISGYVVETIKARRAEEEQNEARTS